MHKFIDKAIFQRVMGIMVFASLGSGCGNGSEGVSMYTSELQVLGIGTAPGKVLIVQKETPLEKQEIVLGGYVPVKRGIRIVVGSPEHGQYVDFALP